MTTPKDEILGKLGVAKGLISPEQLHECIQLQKKLPEDPEPTAGSGENPCHLGKVMLDRGLLTESQLTELMDERNRRVAAAEDYRKIQRAEYLSGQLLVKLDKATQNQINKCLEIQDKMAREGADRIPRLGELLVEHGFVNGETIRNMLKLQNKDILFCTNCNKQYNVVGVEEGKTYRCRGCGGILLPKTLLDTLSVDETTFGVELDQEEKEKP